jgi:hypothetical protein
MESLWRAPRPEILDDVKKHRAVRFVAFAGLPPMLPLEPIGKTYFDRHLSQLLSTGFGLCSIAR